MKQSAKQPAEYCRVDRAFKLISTKWSAHIIWLLGQNECLRFGQIQKQLALVSSKVLSQRLKFLEEDGFIWRRQESTIPVTVYYGLTHKGKELSKIIELIEAKSSDWYD